eukprot:1552837-Ditylum_brightwellii.AAC.1
MCNLVPTKKKACAKKDEVESTSGTKEALLLQCMHPHRSKAAAELFYEGHWEEYQKGGLNDQEMSVLNVFVNKKDDEMLQSFEKRLMHHG